MKMKIILLAIQKTKQNKQEEEEEKKTKTKTKKKTHAPDVVQASGYIRGCINHQLKMSFFVFFCI